MSHSFGGQKANVKVIEGHTPSRGSGGKFTICCSSCYGLQHSSACGCTTSTSASPHRFLLFHRSVSNILLPLSYKNTL